MKRKNSQKNVFNLSSFSIEKKMPLFCATKIRPIFPTQFFGKSSPPPLVAPPSHGGVCVGYGVGHGMLYGMHGPPTLTASPPLTINLTLIGDGSRGTTGEVLTPVAPLLHQNLGKTVMLLPRFLSPMTYYYKERLTSDNKYRT